MFTAEVSIVIFLIPVAERKIFVNTSVRGKIYFPPRYEEKIAFEAKTEIFFHAKIFVFVSK